MKKHKLKLKKGDTVLVIAGKDKGKKGKILQVWPVENRIMVEGINLRKKHRKPKKSGEKGQTVTLAGPINASNAKLICLKCHQPVRTSYQISGQGKYRACKKCGQET